MARIGFYGFGRFGRALGDLFTDAGHSISAFDVHSVPDSVAMSSPKALAESADVLIVAVPVPLIGHALRELSPHLTKDHLVLDVGSVKEGPERELSDVLGDRIPWTATHPLFGPASLARGERPLEVVVCPNPHHPEAVNRARALFESFGGAVYEQEAAEHDRAMAKTHVLAFFLAKALLEIGAGEGVDFAPPSFRAVARTVDAVRADAGHLFLAIQRENPYAAAMRRRLIDELQNIDEQLDHVVDTGDLDLPPMSIPGLGKLSPELKETRDLIDDVDRELITLLARRFELSRRAGRAKASSGQKTIRDPDRERRLLESRGEWAESRGLDADSVEDIFQSILMHSRRTQRDD